MSNPHFMLVDVVGAVVVVVVVDDVVVVVVVVEVVDGSVVLVVVDVVCSLIMGSAEEDSIRLLGWSGRYWGALGICR